jgi:uroporphyrinogen III methyltransferase/synthase
MILLRGRKGQYMINGKVFLVGAGPGDIGLITLKGIEAINKADVIFYDRLANPKLLEFAPNHCELIYCGKLPERHTMRQEKINQMLVDKARDGNTVVRLKGGDPGVFGRVGEEAIVLAENGIPFEIIPGISSGLAAPLYAGIPVTHREFGETFAVVTAHDKSEDGVPLLEWRGLATSIDTIAFYMGIANLGHICENLIKHGRAETTPVLLIQWGTFGRQKTLEGTLATIARMAEETNFQNPAITLVGDIVSLRCKMNWFEKKPLFGRQILLARTGVGQSKLAQELSTLGADVYEFPKWKKKPLPADKRILNRLETYERILFTSPESTDDFFAILIEEGIDVRNIKAKLYGLSQKSIQALKQKGLLAQKKEEMEFCGKYLIVGDNRYCPENETGDFFQMSQIEIDVQFDQALKLMFQEAKVDTVIFPSSLSVEKFLQEAERTKIFAKDLWSQAIVLCMGEQTAMRAVSCGIKPDIVLKKPEKNLVIESLLKGKSRS